MEKPVPIDPDDLHSMPVDSISTYDANDILGPEKTARFILGNEVYILRKTKQNKLILTK